MSEAAVVLTERRGEVLVITLNRPDARNAADRDMALGVAAALDELDASDDLAVAVLTGAGGTFCAGMDLKAFIAGQLPMIPGKGFLGIAEAPPAKPVIAAVEGYALAGGFEAVLACDLVVAARDAVFGLPEVKRGLVAGGGGLLRLAEMIPANIARELVLTGDSVGAERMADLGLVNRLAEPGGALEAALEFAATIAANGPFAVQVAKRVMRESGAWAPEEKFARQREQILPVFSSADAQEGARAFAEKRRPQWIGR